MAVEPSWHIVNLRGIWNRVGAQRNHDSAQHHRDGTGNGCQCAHRSICSGQFRRHRPGKRNHLWKGESIRKKCHQPAGVRHQLKGGILRREAAGKWRKGWLPGQWPSLRRLPQSIPLPGCGSWQKRCGKRGINWRIPWA